MTHLNPSDHGKHHMAGDTEKADADFLWFEDRCRALERVQQEFERVAIAGSDLFHAMFQADDRGQQHDVRLFALMAAW